MARIQNFPFATLIGALALAGCVGGSTLPSSNLAALLTPVTDDNTTDPKSADGKKEETVDALESKLTSAETEPALSTSKTTLSPAIKNALLPDTPPETPAQKAATEVTQGNQPVKPDTPGTDQPAVALAALSPTKVPDSTVTKPVAKKSTGGFFENLFKSNSANRVKNNTKTRASRAGVKRTVTTRKRGSANSSNWGSRDALPGVRTKSLFGIDTEEVEELDEPTELASVTNRARRGTHGLLLQREGVLVGCFPPKLVRLLKQVERRFGRTPIVTSGYRSRAYNRRIRGARNSMHIHCKAADIQVRGVSKWKLAKYLRSLPGRGGVGTYCHTKSVHIDIAGKRDWNRRCRRSKRRKRKRKA